MSAPRFNLNEEITLKSESGEPLGKIRRCRSERAFHEARGMIFDLQTGGDQCNLVPCEAWNGSEWVASAVAL
jgi:hypothetical protein